MNQYVDHEVTSRATEAGAIGVSIATIAGWLPSVSAVLAIVLLAIRIYIAVEEARIKRVERKAAEKTNVDRFTGGEE